MRFIQVATSLTIAFFLCTSLASQKFTFLSAGDWSDVSNWDTYPGVVINSGDTIEITANINFDVPLNLTSVQVNVLSSLSNIRFLENCEFNLCQFSYTAGYSQSITIDAAITVGLNDCTIINGFDGNTTVTNNGNGISSISTVGLQIADYYNMGTSTSTHLANLVIDRLENCGSIIVDSPSISTPYMLEMCEGSISGNDPYIMFVNNDVTQSLGTGSGNATITNASSIVVQNDVEFRCKRLIRN